MLKRVQNKQYILLLHKSMQKKVALELLVFEVEETTIRIVIVVSNVENNKIPKLHTFNSMIDMI